MSEAWHHKRCPECDITNWICNGDESDLSATDVEGIKCFSCGHKYYIGFDYDEASEFGGWDSIDDCNWELGKESPE
jgi:hypothetical protein